jgi:hypothetical protein
MALKYLRVQRTAKPEDLVQCIFTAAIYTVEFINDKGALVVEDPFSDEGSTAGDFKELADENYYVLEKYVERDE